MASLGGSATVVVRSTGEVAAPGRVLVDGVHDGGGERASRVAGMGIPVGIKSPSRDRDGEEVLPMSLHGDGDGDGGNLPPWGWGWGSNPRRGILR